MNLLFDECMPLKWFRQFADMLARRKQPIHAAHIPDRLGQGQKDDTIVEWMREQDPPLLMISGDNGMGSKQGDPRLPLLCPKNQITSIIIGRKLCQQDGFEKVRMMMVCLPAIERAYAGTRGARFRLERLGDGYRLREWQP